MAKRNPMIGDMLVSHSRKGGLMKADIDVYVRTKRKGDAELGYDETKYLKEDLKREKEQLKGYKAILDNWVPEDVAAKAEADVKQKMAECKLRVQELSARLKLRSKKR